MVDPSLARLAFQDDRRGAHLDTRALQGGDGDEGDLHRAASACSRRDGRDRLHVGHVNPSSREDVLAALQQQRRQAFSSQCPRCGPRPHSPKSPTHPRPRLDALQPLHDGRGRRHRIIGGHLVHVLLGRTHPHRGLQTRDALGQQRALGLGLARTRVRPAMASSARCAAFSMSVMRSSMCSPMALIVSVSKRFNQALCSRGNGDPPGLCEERSGCDDPAACPFASGSARAKALAHHVPQPVEGGHHPQRGPRGPVTVPSLKRTAIAASTNVAVMEMQRRLGGPAEASPSGVRDANRSKSTPAASSCMSSMTQSSGPRRSTRPGGCGSSTWARGRCAQRAACASQRARPRLLAAAGPPRPRSQQRPPARGLASLWPQPPSLTGAHAACSEATGAVPILSGPANQRAPSAIGRREELPSAIRAPAGRCALRCEGKPSLKERRGAYLSAVLDWFALSA